MLLGRSIFHSVLERLEAEADARAPERETPPSHRISGLNAGFAADAAETEAARHKRMESAYLDMLAENPPSPPPAPEPDPMPAYLEELSPEAIAVELCLGEEDGAAALQEKRRLFARRNHPDCVAPPFRENATIRMTIANRLIDEALRKRRSG